ncbi:MAG TPA: zf-TFIIB domain-containing protein [Candidatus Omnitrophota bacterium]|nr:zf-TFIIB domain-containing protein [Candidatus Omnitrophota bacterium]
MKKCPVCSKTNLKQEIFHNVEVDYCPDCLGIWFEEDELKWAKDEKDADLKWLDIDLWKNPEKFKISTGKRRLCPKCRMPLYEVYYENSGIIVDACNLCCGLWLDKGEFKKIIDWLKEKADYEILHNYSKTALKQFAEVISGPDDLKEEIADVLVVAKMLKYKLLTQHPVLSKILTQIPK